MIDDLIKRIACAFLIVGAFCIATQNLNSVFFMLVGTVLFFIWSIRKDDTEFTLLNLCFLFMYGYGAIDKLI